MVDRRTQHEERKRYCKASLHGNCFSLYRVRLPYGCALLTYWIHEWSSCLFSPWPVVYVTAPQQLPQLLRLIIMPHKANHSFLRETKNTFCHTQTRIPIRYPGYRSGGTVLGVRRRVSCPTPRGVTCTPATPSDIDTSGRLATTSELRLQASGNVIAHLQHPYHYWIRNNLESGRRGYGADTAPT
ncbi:hypothetical protein BDV19DRAFT_22648 [Aspergillus venezuelensis]